MYLKPVLSLILPVISMLELSTSFADENKTYVVSGIDDVTEIVVDEFGVPHIYAENHYDVFFAQGFNAARDRLCKSTYGNDVVLVSYPKFLASNTWNRIERPACLFIVAICTRSGWLTVMMRSLFPKLSLLE